MRLRALRSNPAPGSAAPEGLSLIHISKKGQGDNVEAQMSDFTKSLTAMLAKHRKKPILWYDINKSYYHKGETLSLIHI